MNTKKWLLASVVVFITIFILEFITHGILLKGLYQQTVSIWRPMAEMQSMMWVMWLGYLIFAPCFVWIYSKGIEVNKDVVGQGFRYGLVFGIGSSAMMSLGWYVVLPIPCTLACAWFVAGVVEFTAAGIVTALVYR